MKFNVPDIPWIKDGKCINDGKYVCNLGFACDGCPYNKDGMAKAKHYAFPKSKVDLKKIKPRICCACKKPKKIVNIGGPPLCKDCFPLASNWAEAMRKQEEFHRNLAGFVPDKFKTGIDDADYYLDEIAEYLTEAHLKIRQAEICLFNIQTAIRLEREWNEKEDTKKKKRKNE